MRSFVGGAAAALLLCTSTSHAMACEGACEPREILAATDQIRSMEEFVLDRASSCGLDQARATLADMQAIHRQLVAAGTALDLASTSGASPSRAAPERPAWEHLNQARAYSQQAIGNASGAIFDAEVYCEEWSRIRDERERSRLRLLEMPANFRTVILYPVPTRYCSPLERDTSFVTYSAQAEVAAENLEIAATWRRKIAEAINAFVQPDATVPAPHRDAAKQAEAVYLRTQEVLEEADALRSQAAAVPVVDCNPAVTTRQDDAFSIFADDAPDKYDPSAINAANSETALEGVEVDHPGIETSAARSPWDGPNPDSPWDSSSPSSAWDSAPASASMPARAPTDSSPLWPGPAPLTGEPVTYAWHHSARRLGKDSIVYCGPYPERNTAGVYGTDVYGGPSVLCRAAVHAGAITFERGGRFIVRFSAPGDFKVTGSTRNGIESADLEEHGVTFRVFPME